MDRVPRRSCEQYLWTQIRHTSRWLRWCDTRKRIRRYLQSWVFVIPIVLFLLYQQYFVQTKSLLQIPRKLSQQRWVRVGDRGRKRLSYRTSFPRSVQSRNQYRLLERFRSGIYRSWSTGYFLAVRACNRTHFIFFFIQIFDWREDRTTGLSSWLDLGRVCGRNTPTPFNSTSHRMKILFRSNNAIQGDGFRARWNENCGGVIPVYKETQYITSPGYPIRYKSGLSCNYTFVAPGKNFILEFTDFQLEEGSELIDNLFLCFVISHSFYI